MGVRNEIVNIREAGEGEWHRVPLLHRDAGEEYMKGSEERNKVRFARIPRGTQIVLFAEQGNRVVGSIQLQLIHKDSRLADGKTVAHFDDFVVDPDFRGQGIGKELLVTAERVLREQGFVKVTLSVRCDEKHEVLCQFYGRRGYRVFYEKADKTSTILAKDI
jgi:ribosomal protein S18 acetylase RimI-like enzyme